MTITGTSGLLRFNSSRNWKPSVPGMRTSVNTTSGEACVSTLNAARALSKSRTR